MRIAVTYENGQVFQHFGHSEQFKVYDIEKDSVVNQSILDANGSGHGALAELLHDNKVDVLICGGVGGGAKMALQAAGIALYAGVSGDADSAVKALLDGSLDFDPQHECAHHQHHDGDCGDHDCGAHHCQS
ncbi:MAG: NifB/NifX family molybdenum-iron cluster-binding protein [Firmicutes bacterium]|nr:NifB/NifX family molybdenum-iron cluster-binding protein [Bacillota bacterium]